MKYEIPELTHPLEFSLSSDSLNQTEISAAEIKELEQFVIRKHLKTCCTEMGAIYEEQGLCDLAFLYANSCLQVLKNPDFTKQDETFKDDVFPYIFSAMDFLKDYLELKENTFDLNQIKDMATKIQSNEN
jgi:hypothetical protein